MTLTEQLDDPNLIAKLSEMDSTTRKEAEFALNTPDLYPAKSVAAAIGVPVPSIWKWRKNRSIKKSDS